MTTAHPPIYARPEETAVRALLAAAGLPVADLTTAHLTDFWGCGSDSDLAGVVGLEAYGDVALLRSLAVAPDWQGRGLGAVLLAHAEQAARLRGIGVLYLLTTTAETFFARRGYIRIPRESAPPVLRHSAEFATLCPASAACMTKTLASPVVDPPATDAMARFEDLPLDARRAAERAACRFLMQNQYVSLDDACQTLGLMLPELWSRIQRDAGLPDSEPPVFSPFA
jgi:amino-acid N-acetyltransferase